MALTGRQIYAHGVQFPDSVVANKLACKACVSTRTFVAARLQNTFIAPYGINNGSAFGNCVDKRFFTVDIFAGLCGSQRNKTVPVVGRADGDCVDIISCKELSKIGIGVEPFKGTVG